MIAVLSPLIFSKEIERNFYSQVQILVIQLPHVD